jgi:hypothetical protein
LYIKDTRRFDYGQNESGRKSYKNGGQEKGGRGRQGIRDVNFTSNNEKNQNEEEYE